MRVRPGVGPPAPLSPPPEAAGRRRIVAGGVGGSPGGPDLAAWPGYLIRPGRRAGTSRPSLAGRDGELDAALALRRGGRRRARWRVRVGEAPRPDPLGAQQPVARRAPAP